MTLNIIIIKVQTVNELESNLITKNNKNTYKKIILKLILMKQIH